MVDRFHLHLGYEITLAMHHNAIDNRVGVIFATPYIFQLIRGILGFTIVHLMTYRVKGKPL